MGKHNTTKVKIRSVFFRSMSTHTKKILKAGSGKMVEKGSTVTVHALGQQLVNGEKVKFWSTKDPGQKPFTYQSGVGKVIRGWDDGLGGSLEGEVCEITIPGEFGYGPNGFPAWGIKPNATLVFELTVLKIE